MIPDDQPTSPKAPYLPYTSFRRFIGSLKAGALPSRIDKTLMPGQSGSMQSWIISALKFFQLIDENGLPTESLSLLVGAEGEDRKPIWRRLFEVAYAPIINGLNLERATLGQLNERFGKDFSSETVRKCQSFFAAAAEEAGIPLAEHLKPKARGTGPRKMRRNKPAVVGSQNSAETTGHQKPEGHLTATLILDADGARKVTLTAPLAVSAAELERIQKWLSFQLIVKD